MKSNAKRVIAFGDSIMKGVVTESGSCNTKYKLIQESITDHCRNQLGAQVKNFGRIGCTIKMGEEELKKHISEIEPRDIVILSFGGNDSNYDWDAIAQSPDEKHDAVTPISEYKQTYIRILNAIIEKGSMPIVMSLPPIDAERYFAKITKTMKSQEKKNVLKWLDGNINNINNGHELYNLETIKIAQSMMVPYIDVTSTFLKNRRYADYICSDGLHPNEKGQEMIAKTVVDYLK